MDSTKRLLIWERERIADDYFFIEYSFNQKDPKGTGNGPKNRHPTVKGCPGDVQNVIVIQKLTLLKKTKRQRPQHYGFMRLLRVRPLK